MSKKLLGMIVAAASIGLIGAVIALTRPQNSTQPTQTTENTNTNTQQQNKDEVVASKTYTANEVNSHSTSDDCWTIINGDVYDVSKYVSSHPGGSEIQRACGTDATTLFSSRTTSDGEKIGSGTPHSSIARNVLSEYRIGVLAQ